jgi:xanthine dehydrogenase accessory factor
VPARTGGRSQSSSGGSSPSRSATRPCDNRSVQEILPEIERWQEAGEQIVVATVVANRRSAPRPVGSSLAVTPTGKLCGSVSGGCVEGDVVEQAREVFATGEPKLLSYGISDEQAWSVGLPCGGEIDVFVERL